jgi:hypothetical protein
MSDLSEKPKPNNAPTYMCLYPGLAEIARANGYALAVHGSLARDMDLIAVPWIESPEPPEKVIAAIESQFAIKRIGELTGAPHGRMIQTIGISFGECFIDLSFMPATSTESPKGSGSLDFTYSSTQSTSCAGCGKHKHTPLRVDAMGGYVCLTCIDERLEALLIEESARDAEPDWDGCREISNLPLVHDDLQAFSADPTEDNAISVVQAIVMAITRKPAE